ncbi:sulfatase-like hydrolase/transferase [Rufibacter roseus]|uniref:Sulfatase-like hydrolase/transferase n=1 Tax=Rufibacter roseus TaxID=1567108 RepID=A0ABW2DQ03_9BACT|nr:sulfatase-like hydrolase/transferase [Rufibacter roseus]
MRQHFQKYFLWYAFAALTLYVITVEMRPGRLYFLLTYLLFQDSLLNLLLYLTCFGLSVIGLLALLLNKNKVIFWATAGLLAPCLLISLTFRFISGYNFMYSDAVLAWNNLALADAVFPNYAKEIALATGATLLLLGCLLLFRRKTTWRTFTASSALFPLAAVAAFSLIKWSSGVVDDFPALYRVPLGFATAISDRVPQPERAPAPILPTAQGIPHLFLIVDESITATELTLHQPELQTTPFLFSVREQLHDFGVASSFTNQSGGSNIALMSGTRLSEIPDNSFKTFSRTNIFQFAQKAGYTTYYIDAQQAGPVLQNFMSPEDLKYIDQVERPAEGKPDLPYYERDMLVAQRLAQLAKAPGKVFAYVVKAGAHWPYARTYPPDSVFFSPILSPRSIYKDKQRTLNTYHNALRWTVDEFWRKLMLNIAPIDSTVILYTSDHGQNLNQAGISLTHASVHNTSPQEAAVPLWLWDSGNLVQLDEVKKPGKYSHAHIFPTLLQLQGYSPIWVRQQYGSSLLETPSSKAPQRIFLSGDLFGRGPHSVIPFEWKDKEEQCFFELFLKKEAKIRSMREARQCLVYPGPTVRL